MAELVDAQDLKSCGLIIRPGSIPGICTNDISVRTNGIDRYKYHSEKGWYFFISFFQYNFNLKIKSNCNEPLITFSILHILISRL